MNRDSYIYFWFWIISDKKHIKSPEVEKKNEAPTE